MSGEKNFHNFHIIGHVWKIYLFKEHHLSKLKVEVPEIILFNVNLKGVVLINGKLEKKIIMFIELLNRTIF